MKHLNIILAALSILIISSIATNALTVTPDVITEFDIVATSITDTCLPLAAVQGQPTSEGTYTYRDDLFTVVDPDGRFIAYEPNANPVSTCPQTFTKLFSATVTGATQLNEPFFNANAAVNDLAQPISNFALSGVAKSSAVPAGGSITTTEGTLTVTSGTADVKLFTGYIAVVAQSQSTSISWTWTTTGGTLSSTTSPDVQCTLTPEPTATCEVPPNNFVVQNDPTTLNTIASIENNRDSSGVVIATVMPTLFTASVPQKNPEIPTDGTTTATIIAGAITGEDTIATITGGATDATLCAVSHEAQGGAFLPPPPGGVTGAVTGITGLVTGGGSGSIGSIITCQLPQLSTLSAGGLNSKVEQGACSAKVSGRQEATIGDYACRSGSNLGLTTRKDGITRNLFHTDATLRTISQNRLEDALSFPASGDIETTCTSGSGSTDDKCFFKLADNYVTTKSTGGVTKQLVSTGAMTLFDPANPLSPTLGRITPTTDFPTTTGPVRFKSAKVVDANNNVLADLSGSATTKGTGIFDGSGANALILAPAGRAEQIDFNGASCQRILQNPLDRVIDRFMTSGTTTVCAKKSTITGSQIDVYEPESIPAGSTIEVPFIYETPDTYWTTTASLMPPTGCTADSTQQTLTVSQDTVAAVFGLACSTNTITGAAITGSTTANKGKAIGANHRVTDHTKDKTGRDKNKVTQLNSIIPLKPAKAKAATRVQGAAIVQPQTSNDNTLLFASILSMILLIAILLSVLRRKE